MKEKANWKCLPCKLDLVLRGDMVLVCRTLVGSVRVDVLKISKE